MSMQSAALTELLVWWECESRGSPDPHTVEILKMIADRLHRNDLDYDGHTLLHHCLRHSTWSVIPAVTKLIDRQPDSMFYYTKKDRNGFAPIHWAIRSCHEDLAYRLIKLGVPIDVTDPVPDSDCDTLLRYMVSRDQFCVLHAVIQRGILFEPVRLNRPACNHAEDIMEQYADEYNAIMLLLAAVKLHRDNPLHDQRLWRVAMKYACLQCWAKMFAAKSAR